MSTETDACDAIEGAAVEDAPWRRWRAKLGVPGAYLATAVILYSGLWIGPGTRYLIDSGHDQNQWEWFFAVTAKAVAEGENPLFTTLQNHPDGVNLMANTTMLGVSLPLAWLTLLLGPGFTWALVLTASLAATAWAWYRLMRRRLDLSLPAAAIGGALCGFAPSVISHGNGHPNFVALFVLPFIVDRLIRLWNRGRPVRNGAILGLLVAYQIFVGEEILLLFATGMTVFAIAYAAARPREALRAARTLCAGLGVGAGVSLAVVVFPLWWQFFGPQSYHSLLHGHSGNDLVALTTYATRSLGGYEHLAGTLASPTEQNAFFGWPLVILTAGIAVTLWRYALARALSIVVVTAAALSLGSPIHVAGTDTGIPGPWYPVSLLPLYESVLSSRVAMICVPAMAILLAMAIDQVRHQLPQPWWQRSSRWLSVGALAAVLVPIAPTPYATVDRIAVPEFFGQGLWREYVPEGGTVVPVPVTSPGETEPLQWQIAADLDFAVPEGYFIGPGGPDRAGIYGAVSRPTAELLRGVQTSGDVPDLDADQLRSARTDLEYWDADAVVLGPTRNQDELRATVEQLLGDPDRVGGVWVWRVGPS